MHAVTFPWQQLPGNLKVKCITVLKDGTYIGMGEDGVQYARSATTEWTPVNAGDGARFGWASQLRDGGMLYVGLDGNLYTRATPNSPHALIGGSGTVKAAAQMRNGTIIAVGMDGWLWTRANLYGDWSQIPNSGTMIGITIMADDTIIGIGTDNHLYAWGAITGGWSKVLNSGYVIAIADLPDGSLLGIGTNGLVHKAPRLFVGTQSPGFSPLEMELDSKLLVQPTTAFYKWGGVEQQNSDKFLGYAFPSGSPEYLAVRAYKQKWNDLAEFYSFSSLADYKAAWVAFINSLTKLGYTALYEPIVVLGNNCFDDAPGYAAYFKGNGQDFSERHARLFASTKYYRGPGRYSILCANMQVISVLICADTLGGKVYKLVSASSGLVLTVKDDNATAGAQLVQAVDTGVMGQRWYLRVTTGQGYSVVSTLQERVIDVTNGSPNPGVGLQLWDATGSTAQFFKLVQLMNGNYVIVNATTGLALDVPGSATTAGTQIVQWNRTDGLNQQWKLVSI